MSGTRQELVKRLQAVIGDNSRFIYGAYHSLPPLPYGNYAEQPIPRYKADNKDYVKIKQYIVRLVTMKKDFDLEDKFEDAFNDLEIAFEKITDQDVIKQHSYCVEWLIQVIE